MPDIGCLGFLERVGLPVDREIAERDSRRLADRLRLARLKQAACLEDLDLHTPRQLDRSLILKLAGRVTRHPTSACPGCWRNWKSHTATGATRN